MDKHKPNLEALSEGLDQMGAMSIAEWLASNAEKDKETVATMGEVALTSLRRWERNRNANT